MFVLKNDTQEDFCIIIPKNGTLPLVVKYAPSSIQWGIRSNLDIVPVLGGDSWVNPRGKDANRLTISEIPLVGDVSSYLLAIDRVVNERVDLALGRRLIKDLVVESSNLRESTLRDGLPVFGTLEMVFVQYKPVKIPTVTKSSKLSEAQLASAKEQLKKANIYKAKISADGIITSNNIVIGRVVNGKVSIQT